MVKVRGSKKKSTSESSTQTSPLMGLMNPSVLLQKLNLNLNSSRTHSQSVLGEPSELSIKNPPLITTHSKRSSISRAPHSYKYFVKPITNNEKVNSTLGNLSDTDECRRRYCTRRSAEHNRIGFIRPGPMCYKRRVLQALGEDQVLEEDMDVPIMLADPSEQTNFKLPVSLPLPNVNLDTILENTAENSIIPELEMNFDFDNLERVDSNNIETQTEVDDIPIPQVTEDSTAPQVENYGESDSDPIEDQPQRIHIDFKGVTTVISRASTQETLDESSSDCSTEKETGAPGGKDKFDKKQRFVKIKAHTVHIHNHFYKT